MFVSVVQVCCSAVVIASPYEGFNYVFWLVVVVAPGER
jgi:hypothetical protein